MTGQKRNVIKEKSYEFALEIISLCQEMRKEKEYFLSKQLVRSGTSIGANVEEASAAQSRKDFVAKMAISSKEARETHYWLRLIEDSRICNRLNVKPLIVECEELIRLLTSIVKTSQEST